MWGGTAYRRARLVCNGDIGRRRDSDLRDVCPFRGFVCSFISGFRRRARSEDYHKRQRALLGPDAHRRRCAGHARIGISQRGVEGGRGRGCAAWVGAASVSCSLSAFFPHQEDRPALQFP